MRAFRQVWPWVRPYLGYGIAALMATVISVGINVAIPVLTSRVIDRGIVPGDGSFVARIALVMIGLITVGIAASATAAVLGIRLSFNATTDLRADLFAHTQQLSFADLDRLASGELLTRLTSDMTRVTTVLAMAVSFLAQIPIMFIGSLSAIVAIDPSLLRILAVMVPIVAVVVMYTIRRSNAGYDAVQSRLDRLNTVLQETIAGAEVIKGFVRQDHEAARIDQAVDDLADDAARVNRLVVSLFPTLVVITSVGIAAVLWLGGTRVIDGHLTQGELVAFLSYLTMVAMPMMMFAFLQPMISAATASMDRIAEVLAVEPAVADPDPDQAIDLGSLASPGTIRFDGVSFRYGASDSDASKGAPTQALCDISLEIAAGSTAAILGATGSGKSTLVQLIARFYDPQQGTVSLGGVDVARLAKDSVRDHVAIAMQQPHLFAGTVAENLRMGSPDATDAELAQAAEIAQAAGFIADLDGGYDAKIEQRGANLSGGQRQRLALARTLLTRPSVLILDDTTSAVDASTEARIQQGLTTLENMTVILVAQRISTALGADEIVVLDRGRVVDHGTHDQLLGRCDIYRDIVASQLGATT